MEGILEKNNYNQIIEKSLENNNKLNVINYQEMPKKQNEFLETTLGKTINGAIDLGLRCILPDLIENQVINIKDTLFRYGLKEGINQAINSGLELGKSAVGILTGKFDNISQIESAIQKGGIIDSVSKSIDQVLNFTVKKGIIPNEIGKVIKSSKNILMDNMQKNIEKTMTNQIKGIEKIDESIHKWNQYLKEENFSKMELEYKKVSKELENLVPLEVTLKKARELENLHLLIKNKGENFVLNKEEVELAKKLI